MMVDGEAAVWIPARLAYEGKDGPQGMLVFDIELLKIESVDQVVANRRLWMPTGVLLPRLNIPPRTRASSSFVAGSSGSSPAFPDRHADRIGIAIGKYQ